MYTRALMSGQIIIKKTQHFNLYTTFFQGSPNGNCVFCIPIWDSLMEAFKRINECQTVKV